MASKYDALIDDVAQPTVAEPPPVVQDKYGALIDEVTDTTPLHNSLFDATGTNPDQEVKNLKLAKELNTPAAILPADAEEQALLKRNNADDLTARSPATAKFLAKGSNAKVTGLQGVKSLEDVEAAYKTYSPENIKRFIDNYTSANKTAGEAAQRLTEMKKQGINLADELDPYRRETADIFKDPLKAAAAGANTMIAGLNEIGQFAPQQRVINAAIDAITPKRKALFLDVQAGLNRGSEYWQGQKSPAMQKLNKEFEQAGIADSVSMLLEHPQLTADLLAVSTPYLVGGSLVAKGGATTVSMYNALVEAGDAANTARQEAIAAGASEEDQDRAATIAVLITAPTVFLGNKLLGTGKLEADFFTKGSVGDNLLKSTIKEALSGAIEEGSNKFSTNVAASTYDDNRQLLEGVGKAALIGGILESTHAVGMSVAERSLRTFIKDVDQTVTNNGDLTNKAAEATAAHDTLESLGAKVADNELRTRSPEAFHEFVETMADEQQLQDVYIDGKTMLTAIEAEYATLRAEQPELVARIEEAAALGNDVQLPVADYLTHIAGTPLEANVLGSLKADPAGVTYKEAQVFYKDQADVFQSQVQAVAEANEEVLSREEFENTKREAENNKPTSVPSEGGPTQEVAKSDTLPATYEEYLAQHKNKREVYARDVDTVETNLYTQFAEAKRFTPTVNRAYVAPLVEFYKVQAKKFGVMPSELLRQYSLKIRAFMNFGTGFELNQSQPATVNDFKPENVGNILTKDNWVILTPNDPNNTPTPEDNPRLQAEFVAELKAQGTEYLPVVGKYGSIADSFILFNTPPEQALELGRKWNQESVLTRDGFVYQDGSRQIATGVTVHKTAPKDYYTTVTLPDGTETIFTVDIDFSQRVPMGEMSPVNPETVGALNQTELPAIKKWFGNSKVVDADGNPLVVYHGTADSFNTFSLDEGAKTTQAANEGGFFFAVTPELASAFAREAGRSKASGGLAGSTNGYEGANVMPTYLSIKNPKTVEQEDVMSEKRDEWVNDPAKMARVIAKAREEGYDGLYITKYMEWIDNKIFTQPQWVAFEPNQIKSAVGNVGTFDGNNDNILYQGLKVGQVMVKGVHYSDEKRTTLNGAYYGTGAKGAEADRVRASKDSRIKSRVHFYVDEGKGVFPEYGVGNVPHTVTMANMYDGARNPLRFPTKDANDPYNPDGFNLFESAVIDAGFDGYYIENGFGRQGVAVMLGDAARSVIPDSEKGTTLPDPEKVKARFAEELKNPDIEAIYNGRPDALGGKVLNTDVARELSSDYLANRSLGATVHKQSNKFIKKLYAKRLAEAPKNNELPVVLFTAGGTGAGKTSAILQGDPTALDRKQIVYDTNMASYESSKEKVEQALAAGKAVDIILTVRDPVDGFINGALKRAMRQEQEFGTGRAVPILNHASTYIGAPVTVQQLAEDYKDDPRVSVKVLDNSFGRNNAVEISVANANKYVYNSQDELEQILMEVLLNEYEKGTISEAVARATAHTSRGNETNRIRPKKDGQGDSQGPEQSGLVYQSVSTRTPSSVGSEDPHLTSGLAVGLESLDKAPALKAKVAKIVAGYMTFKKGPKTTESIIESFLQQTEANLLWVYDQVPEALRARSKKWYEGGSLVADRWVDKYQGRYTKAQMVAALAVMSPTMPWDINISLSERLVDIYTNNQDSAWDEGMTQVADSIAENNPKRKMLLDSTRGKTLAEVEGTEAKGAWMRIYDEAHNPRSYRLPTPEGGFGDIAMTKSGKPSSVAYINGFGPIAKVVSVLQNGNMDNISRQLGEAHKVRNFYNNLFDPTDATSVTIDTHAVAVGLLLPLGASSTEVMNALNGTGGKNAEQGLTGTYSLFAEAYRRAAQARGVLPREMQSITWEAGRGLFNPAFKSAHQKNPAKLKAIWDDFTSGKADIDETRDRIREAAGGIQEPAWTKYDAGLYEGAPASSYTSDVLGAGGTNRTTTGGYGSGATGGVSVNQGTRGSYQSGLVDQTQTPAEFKAWFGDSKVVDADGNPLMVHHGTNTPDFDYFETPSYFTDHPEEASAYTFTNRIPAIEQALKKYTISEDTTHADKDVPYVGVLSDHTDLKVGGVYATDEGVFGYKGDGQWTAYANLEVDYDAPYSADTARIIEGDGSNAVEKVNEYLDFVKTFPDGTNGRIIPVYLSIKNPKELSALEGNLFGKRLGADDAEVRAKIAEYKSQGYDGIVTESDEARVSDEVRRALGRVPKHYIPFDASQIKSAIGNNGNFDANNPNILEQTTRGSFNLDTLTMTMLQGADLSTVIHESGHFYLKMLETLAARADAPQEVKDDFQRTMDWFGVTSNAWQAMSLEQQRPYHEQWAESYERWTMEGKAPTSQLQPIFSRFGAWLVFVYKSIDEFVRLHPAAGKLNDEVRGVFSRLLASQEAIAASESARAYQPLYANAKDAGVSEETYASYIELGQQATQNATDDLQARSLRDMKWLTNARNRALQELQATAKETRAKVMLEVTKEVNAEPVYQAVRFLRRGETVDPKTGAAIKATKGYKLDAKIIDEMYPDTALDSPDLTKLRGMTMTDGLSPDIVASMFGFSSGDAMVRELIEAENMNEKIEGLTDQRMLEEHGDLIDERSVQRAADEAVHNEARAKFMATGLKMLTKSPISVSQLSKAAKAAAETVIANKRVRDVKPKQFLAAETRANKEVIKLVAKKPQEAAEQQRVALLNNRLAAVAQDAVTEVEKALRYLGKFNNEGTRKNLDLEYLEQIDDLLVPFDLRKGLSLRTIDSRTTLAEWITEQEAMGFEPTIDPVAMAEAKTKSYKNMKMSEVRALVDTIKQIEHMGRMKKKLLTALDRADFLERINEAKISIALNANRVVEEKGTPSDALGILAQWGRQMLASHRKFTSFMRELDGAKWNGALYNLLVRPMATASSTETQMKAEAAERLAELFEPIRAKISSFGNLYNRKRVVPGTMISMTHEQRIMFAMNWGNEGNRQRLLDGGITGKKAMSQQEARAVLDTLTKEEWDFVQGIWDYLGTYKPMVEAQERQLTGKTPEWIEAAPVETKFGTYPGGYFPAKYDAVLSTRSDALEAVTDLRSAMKGAFGAAAARNNYTKERSTQVKGRPLLLNFNAISRHTNEVIHRLAWQAWLVDANRVVRALDSDFRTHLGAEATKEISDAIRDIAQGDAPANTPVEVALNRVRTGTSIVAMGWGISTALLQPSGISNSIARVGVRNMTKGLARFMANPIAASDWVNANSVAMQNRGRTMNREMNEILNTVRAGKGVSAVTGSFFYLTGKFQRMVDVPTYMGAYERALEELKYEEATSAEDRASIEKKAHDIAGQTVVDTQGGGEMKDLAKVQRGSPLYKLFTNFYSYMSTVYNQNVEAVRTTDFKNPAEIAAFTAEMLLINFFPVVFSVALKNALKGSCEWDDTECLAGRYQSEQISHLFGQMVGVREVGVSVDAATGGEAFGYTGPAGLRFFADVYKSAIQLNQGEADIALLKALNNALGALFHYPAGQLNKTLEGAIAIENGEVEGAAILPALISGPQK